MGLFSGLGGFLENVQGVAGQVSEIRQTFDEIKTGEVAPDGPAFLFPPFFPPPPPPIAPPPPPPAIGGINPQTVKLALFGGGAILIFALARSVRR